MTWAGVDTKYDFIFQRHRFPLDSAMPTGTVPEIKTLMNFTAATMKMELETETKTKMKAGREMHKVCLANITWHNKHIKHQ